MIIRGPVVMLICQICAVFSLPVSPVQHQTKAALCSLGPGCPTECICGTVSSGNLLVDCGKKGMTQLPRSLPLNTELLLLKENKLTNLPDNGFAGCSSLLHLDLSSNNIKHLSASTFGEIDQLRTLLLNNNSIDFTSSEAPWQNVTNLLKLSIHDNFMPGQTTDYNDQQFAHLDKLQNLTIDGVSNATLGPGFSGLRSLEYLNILGNLQYITNDTFYNLNKCPLKTFKVGSEVLTDVDVMAFSHFKQLQTLDLSFNPLLGFPNVSKSWYGLQYTNISDLILERSAPYNSEIITINRTFFQHLELTRLKKLVLDANNIITIESVFSFHTRHLEYLSLAHNSLRQVLGCLVDLFFLTHLTTLDISFQSRRLLTPRLHKHLKKHMFNDEDIDVGQTNNESNLHNDLPILSWEEAQPYIEHIFTNISLLNQLNNESTLLIKGVGYISKTMPIPPGPMYILTPPRIHILQAAASLNMEFDTFYEITLFGVNQLLTVNYSQNNMHRLVGPIIIKSPPPYLLIVDFSHNDCIYFSPNFSTQVGPFVGTLMLGRNDLGNQLASDINGTVFQPCSKLTTLDLSANNIKSLPNKVFIHQTNMQHIDLRFNSLRQINFSFSHMTHLTSVDLSENLLDQLDQPIRSLIDLSASRHNLTVNLAGNPLQCSCGSLDFLEWVPQAAVILTNWKQYTCMYNGELVNFTRLETVIIPRLQVECHSKTWVIASATVLVSFVILVVLSFAMYRHRFEIRYLCLRLVVKRRYYQALEEQEQTYDFDAFVAFHPNDMQWVDEQLIRQLDSRDGDGEFNLLVHYRDFMPGTRINENIMNGIETSRKVILVLSSHFVESNWCDFELQMAQMRCFDEGKELVVPILLEEELPTMKLTKSLRTLLNRNTYLKWPTDENERPNFWRNLKKAVSSAPDRTIRCQCGQTMKV